MAVGSGDMQALLAMTMATSFTTSNVGGAISSTLFNGVVGQVHFTMAAAATGGSDLQQYAKLFVKNNHASDTINSYGIWLANALDTITSASTISLVSTNASDDSSTTALMIGYSAGGFLKPKRLS